MIWAKEETMSRAEIEAVQLNRLQETVARVYEKCCRTAGRWKRPM